MLRTFTDFYALLPTFTDLNDGDGGIIIVEYPKNLGKKNGQAPFIAPLNLIPLLCSHPGGFKGSWS